MTDAQKTFLESQIEEPDGWTRIDAVEILTIDSDSFTARLQGTIVTQGDEFSGEEWEEETTVMLPLPKNFPIDA